jgi:hypothetical protein
MACLDSHNSWHIHRHGNKQVLEIEKQNLNTQTTCKNRGAEKELI